jgi:hypothetical protein
VPRLVRVIHYERYAFCRYNIIGLFQCYVMTHVITGSFFFMPRFACQLPADPYIIVHLHSCFLLPIVYQGNAFVSTVNYDTVLLTIVFWAVL